MVFAVINRIVYPKMKMLALFIYVISNIYADIFSLEYKRWNKIIKKRHKMSSQSLSENSHFREFRWQKIKTTHIDCISTGEN